MPEVDCPPNPAKRLRESQEPRVRANATGPSRSEHGREPNDGRPVRPPWDSTLEPVPRGVRRSGPGPATLALDSTSLATHEERAITHATFAATQPPGTLGGPPTGYQPGVCNIGSAEVARRRRAGDLGAIVTLVVLVVLIAIHAPPLVRLIVALPAAGAASGYLLALFRFCAGFGSRGIFNFGQVGQTSSVADPDARARDRAKATQIGLASLAIGVAVAALAVVLALAGF